LSSPSSAIATSVVSKIATAEEAIADDGEDKKEDHGHGVPQMGY
jgi:hypothetical protein